MVSLKITGNNGNSKVFDKAGRIGSVQLRGLILSMGCILTRGDLLSFLVMDGKILIHFLQDCIFCGLPYKAGGRIELTPDEEEYNFEFGELTLVIQVSDIDTCSPGDVSLSETENNAIV